MYLGSRPYSNRAPNRRFTARSQPAFKFLGGHQLYSFLENLQAPLGFIDDTRPPEARKVYYDYVRHELQLKAL